MSKKNKKELYDGKSIEDVFKDIDQAATSEVKDLDELIKQISSYVTNMSEASVVIPLVKSLYDVKARNRETVVKMTAVAQKVEAHRDKKTNSIGDGVEINADVLFSNLEKIPSEITKNNKEIPDIAKQIKSEISKFKKVKR